MGDFIPVAAAIVTAIAGAVGTWFAARRLRQLGLGDDQKQVNQTLRELADTWEEKFNLVSADLEAEKTAHRQTLDDLAFERRAAAQCRRDLDDARSQIRVLERRRPRGGA